MDGSVYVMIAMAFLLGVALGYIFKSHLQNYIEGDPHRDDVADDMDEEEEDEFSPEFVFTDKNDFMEDSEGDTCPHPYNVIGLSENFCITIDELQNLGESYSATVEYTDIFDNDKEKNMIVIIDDKIFDEDTKNDDNFATALHYFCMVNLWNKIATDYDGQLPHLASEVDFLIDLIDIHEYIHKADSNAG